MERYSFVLYVAGDSARSQQAFRNLSRLAQECCGTAYDIATVDVVADPDAAEAARILTTPTVVRSAPSPVRRATGDLSEPERVIAALGLPLPRSEQQA